MPPPDLHARLSVGLQALALPLDAAAMDRLVSYLGLLERWNAVYNLTAVRDPAQMLTQHLLDSLAVIAPLERRCPQPGRLLDVGSGAGLPGLVIAVARPSWQITCIDAVAKKARFVRQAAAELGLKNLVAEHGRVEAAGGGSGFDVIISRAFATLADFVALSRHRLADQGRWMAMKGHRPDGEIAHLPADLQAETEPLQVPGLDARRCLVWIQRRR